MINPKLLDFNYYVSKMSLSLRGSHGIIDQMKIYFDILLQIDGVIDRFFDHFPTITPESTMNIMNLHDMESDILDKIAGWFGVSRNLDVSYPIPPGEIPEGGIIENDIVKARLSLDNSELINLIKALIIQNNYQGTYREMVDLYEWMNIPIFINNGGSSATVNLILDNSDLTTSREKHLFLAGMFTVRSMGIRYITQISNITNIGIWNSNNPNRAFNEGEWVK